MKLFKSHLFLLVVTLLFSAGCSRSISGMVELVDVNMQPVADESPEGTVVNMINTTASLEQASHAVTVDAEGNFESSKDAITPGLYKVEAKREGYVTVTETVEIGSYTSEEIKIQLKKIHEGKRRTIRGSESDEDKIINPGEVNIRPPIM